VSDTSLLAVLPVALADLGSATKNSKNPHFRSNYADLASTITALEPLKGHGVWFMQNTLDAESGVAVETFYIGHGETISAGVLFVPATKRDAQGYGSALTYARRYGLQTAFGLATEDDDGNAAVSSHQGQPEPEPIDKEELEKIRSLLEKTETEAKKICDAYNVTDLSKLTGKQGLAVITRLESRL